MSEWTSEICEQWRHEIGSAAMSEVQLALRKAKADGMRLAAFVLAASRKSCQVVDLDKVHGQILAMANDMEKTP
jgi:hypothetical protein